MIPYEDIKIIYSIFSLKRPNNIVHARSTIFVKKIRRTKRSRNVELITRRSSTRGNVQCRQIFRPQKILGNRGNDDPTRIRDRFTLGTNEKGKDSRSTRHNLLKHHRFRGTGARAHTPHTHTHTHTPHGGLSGLDMNIINNARKWKRYRSLSTFLCLD